MHKLLNTAAKKLPYVGAAAIGCLIAPNAWAGGAGKLPWDTPLTTLADDLSGPVARSIGIIAVVIAGLLFAFTEGGTVMRKAVGIVFGLSIAFAATTFVTTLFGAAGGAAF